MGEGVERGEVLWELDRFAKKRSNVGGFMAWLGGTRGLKLADYDALWRWSVDDLPGFWGAIREYFEIGRGDPSVVVDDEHMPGTTWFPGISMNFAERCMRGDDADVVILGVSQTRDDIQMTRGELRDAVARARAGLVRLGVGRGDRVAAWLPSAPETVVALLATASLGAIWTICAPEFGLPSVLDRLQQIAPKVLLMANGYRYGKKDIDLRGHLPALRKALPSVEHVVGLRYLGGMGSDRFGDSDWVDLTSEKADLAIDHVPFAHPLWILFSSGTTGLPKAICHSHGGVTLELCKSHSLHGDLGPKSRFFVTASTSWVMWNLLVGGLLVGSAIVLFDGNINYPDDQEIWRITQKTGTTQLATGSAAIVLQRNAGRKPGQEFNLSRLKGIFCTGSPLPPEAFRYVYEHVKADVYLQSSSGGTDVCGAFVGGSPLLPVRAGEIACSCLGVKAVAYDAAGQSVVEQPGELVIEKPMPSMPIYFWNDPDGQKYRSSYFDMYPGKWRHGDWVVFHADGACRITGRSDGTLNRGGVRLGTAEFYSVLSDVPEVTDSLVVHLEDEGGGLGELLLAVQLAGDHTLDAALEQKIARALRDALSPRHVPDRIVAVPQIPYNLTGKKLEVPVKRLLRGAARAEVVADGAIRDASALDAFEALAKS